MTFTGADKPPQKSPHATAKLPEISPAKAAVFHENEPKKSLCDNVVSQHEPSEKPRATVRTGRKPHSSIQNIDDLRSYAVPCTD